MKKPLVIGSVYTEILNYVDALPKGNEDFTAKRIEQRVRGTGYDTARVFQGFGFPYELLAPVGMGEYAEQVKNECRKYQIPLIQKEGINGCMYTLIDDEGNEGYLCVPGSEYAFDLDDVQYLDPDEISTIILFGERLTGPDAGDLIQALDDLQKPVVFVPGGRGDDIDETIMTSVFQLEPKMFLSDTEAYFIAGAQTNDMQETAELLHHESEAEVNIFRQEEGIYHQDDQDHYFIPLAKKVQFNLLTAGYMTALSAGVDTRRALQFAADFAQNCRQKMPSSNLMDMEKRKLADLILGK